MRDAVPFPKISTVASQYGHGRTVRKVTSIAVQTPGFRGVQRES